MGDSVKDRGILSAPSNGLASTLMDHRKTLVKIFPNKCILAFVETGENQTWIYNSYLQTAVFSDHQKEKVFNTL